MKPYIKLIKNYDVAVVLEAFKGEPELILLESSLQNSKGARYSFLGLNPFLKFRSKGMVCQVNDQKYTGNAFDELQSILLKYNVDIKHKLPFTCGGMGYISYDYGREIEVIPSIAEEDIQMPDCYFNFYDNIIAFDHFDNETYIIACGMLRPSESSAGAIELILQEYEKNTDKSCINSNKIKSKDTIIYSNFTKEEYIETVDKVREYIKDGHIYITNLTQRLKVNTNKDSMDIYKDLKRLNPAPYSAYMSLEEAQVICSSPERFLKIKEGKVETRPIKGTRPRSLISEQDTANRHELINSEKDKAELLMIVDLERNDLSKVCRPHSVKVEELYTLEEYSTVFHLVSTITGELKSGKTAMDCVKACFPGGSITGAPKIRAMEIIEELEKVRRGIYTGSIGYIGFNGNIDLNIVIRTIVMKGDCAYIGVGGGITWDSVKQFEYQETLDKAKALLDALGCKC